MAATFADGTHRVLIEPVGRQMRSTRALAEWRVSRLPRVKRRLIVILLAGQVRPRKAGFSGCGDSRNYVSKPHSSIVPIISYETQGSDMPKLIGYARVSTRQQSADRQEADLVSAGIRRDDLYVDHGVSGTRASRPQFDRALNVLEHGDTLVITTLGRLGRSTQNMLAFADDLRDLGMSRATFYRRSRGLDT